MMARWLISFAVGMLGRVLTARNFDSKLHRQYSGRAAYCQADHDWQVYFDINCLIAAAGKDAGYPAPFIVQAKRGEG